LVEYFHSKFDAVCTGKISEPLTLAGTLTDAVGPSKLPLVRRFALALRNPIDPNATAAAQIPSSIRRFMILSRLKQKEFRREYKRSRRDQR
jgi:hypothetical protein